MKLTQNVQKTGQLLCLIFGWHILAFSCMAAPHRSIIRPAPCPFCCGSDSAAAGQAMLPYRGWFDVSAWTVSEHPVCNQVMCRWHQVAWLFVLNRTWHDEPKWPIFRNELKHVEPTNQHQWDQAFVRHDHMWFVVLWIWMDCDKPWAYALIMLCQDILSSPLSWSSRGRCRDTTAAWTLCFESQSTLCEDTEGCYIRIY